MKLTLRRNLKIILKSIILFLFVFEILFVDMPSILSSRKIIFVLLLIYFISASFRLKGYDNTLRLPINRKLLPIFLFYFGLIAYLLIIYISIGYSSNNENILMYLIYFIMYVLISPVLFLKVFNSAEEFVISFINAVMIQATIIYMQFLSEKCRIFLYNNFHQEGNISFLRMDRATGLGAEGAMLSLILFCGVFSCCYLILFVKKKKNIYLYIMCIYILGACLITARTGFYLSLLTLIIVLFSLFLSKHGVLSFLKILVSILVCVVVTTQVSSIFGIESYRVEYVLDWSKKLFSHGIEDTSAQELLNMKVPELTIETLVGTGIKRGVTNSGTSIQHDSGYVQVCFALGLIIGALSYFMIYKLLFRLIKLIKNKNKNKKMYLNYFIFILIIIEIKEPFMYKYILPFYVILLTLLLFKEDEHINKTLKINKQCQN